MKIVWWVSCPKFTVGVETDELHTITYTAPVTRKFIGQKLGNLVRWFNTFGDTEVVNLSEEQEEIKKEMQLVDNT